MKKKDLIVVRGSRRSCNRYDPSSEKSGLSSAGSGSRAPGSDPAAGGFERSGICRQCQGRGRGSRAHGRGSRREKEPERTSGTGNGTDLEERWCSGARGSGGTKHCSTSPGRRGRCDSGEEKNLGTTKEMAPLVIALGPGFTAGEDVDVVIETKRGHNLGRVIRSGSAVPNTGIPGIIGGYGKRACDACTGGRYSAECGFDRRHCGSQGCDCRD